VLEDNGAGLRTVRLDGADWRVFEVRDGVSGLTVLVGETSRARRSILLAVLRSTLWPMCLALPLLVLAVWWVMGRGLAPMHRLRHTLAERRSDALDPVPVGDAPAEMVPVIEVLNALFGRIETLLAGERRFTADAAHAHRWHPGPRPGGAA
jgi:two-component system sensor histidine kinase QseC